MPLMKEVFRLLEKRSRTFQDLPSLRKSGNAMLWYIHFIHVPTFLLTVAIPAHPTKLWFWMKPTRWLKMHSQHFDELWKLTQKALVFVLSAITLVGAKWSKVYIHRDGRSLLMESTHIELLNLSPRDAQNFDSSPCLLTILQNESILSVCRKT